MILEIEICAAKSGGPSDLEVLGGRNRGLTTTATKSFGPFGPGGEGRVGWDQDARWGRGVGDEVLEMISDGGARANREICVPWGMGNGEELWRGRMVWTNEVERENRILSPCASPRCFPVFPFRIPSGGASIEPVFSRSQS